ncbi:MAG: polysaccharide biosynthesis tyrosine autokinase [Actinomycetota bacterium]
MAARPPLAAEGAPEGLDLRHYAEVLWHRKRLIGICLLVGILLAAAYAFLAPKSYRSKAVVEVKPTQVNLADLATAGLDKALNMDTERQVASSQAVANLAADAMGWAGTPQGLVKHVAVDNPTDTQVLEITFNGSSGLQAQQGAAALANAYLKYRQDKATAYVDGQRSAIQADITDLRAEIDSAIAQQHQSKDPEVDSKAVEIKQQDGQAITEDKAKIADLASINTDPGAIIAAPNDPNGQSSPRPKLDVALGAFLGLLVGAGWALVDDRLDDSLRGRDDLEQTMGLPVLAAIPKVESWKGRDSIKLVTIQEPRSPASEAYRTLRTNVMVAATRHDVKTILLSSALEGEGKTTSAANLAVVLAQSGKRVVLVSADMRKPRLHEFFGLENDRGLAEILSHKMPAWEGLRESGVENLWIFTSGQIADAPAELLSSDRMVDFISERRDVVDFIVIDSPPLLAVADGLELAARVDGVLYVADAHTPRSALKEARRQLEWVGARVLGAVLNGAPLVRASSYYGYLPAGTTGYDAPAQAASTNGNRRKGARQRRHAAKS